jgi:succinate dehydrogenase / fumarate reductase flavoprotein subunit
MCKDALDRNESCGGHFREEFQTEEGEALRDDENYKYVATWEMKEVGNWELHKEDLIYENIKIAQRSYK